NQEIVVVKLDPEGYKKFIVHDQLISIMSVHEMTSKCINIDFRFNVPCTLFRQKGAQILCFRGNFYCSVNPKYILNIRIPRKYILQSSRNCRGRFTRDSTDDLMASLPFHKRQ